MRTKTTLLVAASVIVAVALVATAVLAASGGSSSSSASGSAAAPSAATATSQPAANEGATGRAAAVPRGATTISLGTPVGRPIPAGFAGLSIEIRTLENYVGTNPKALNPVFVQLVRNLGPQPILRFGGETTDFSWWPIPGMSRPIGVRYAITKNWLALTKALAEETNARLILGINLEVNSGKVAGAEAGAMVSGIGKQWIDGFELGNEPELYGGLPWFVTHGVAYYGRQHSYDWSDYLHDFSTISKSLPGSVALAGPSIGSDNWSPILGQFLQSQPRVRVATLHRYPTKKCIPSQQVTIGQLLSGASSLGLAASVAPYAGIAHGHGVPLRIDEMNSVSCGGELGVSNTFSTALWAVDALFAMARAGINGVNIHTTPKSFNQLFNFQQVKGKWQADIHPEYYGLMMFAQAAPGGARMLKVAGAPGGTLSIWATKAPNGLVRVVLINKATSGARTVAVRATSKASATLERLQARNVSAASGVTLGGRALGSTTGSLVGTPREDGVPAVSGRYVVKVPAASAATLTLPAP